MKPSMRGKAGFGSMKKKLTNPFVLGLQGFLAGALLFWATHGAQADAPAAGGSAGAAPVEQIAGL
jgi:hypothetical protein